MFTPCSGWATGQDLPVGCDKAELTPAVINDALGWANAVLFALTDHRWPGVCSDTIRPNVECCIPEPRCRDYYRLTLPASVVRSVDDVVIGGVVLDPDAYELVDDNVLVRRDGQTWPCSWCCASPGPDDFRVSYTWGVNPPGPFVRAAGQLAYQYALAWTPSRADQCRLPAAASTVTRQGITITRPDPGEVFATGRTGLPDIDLLLSSLRRVDANYASVVVPGARRPVRG